MANTGNILRAVIMGPAGSGKGTIAARIVTDFGMKHLSCGDFLRDHITRETNFGVEAKKYISHGKLVPDELATEVMLHEISKCLKDHILIDGFPRTVVQAERLLDAITINGVMELDVPNEVIIKRLQTRWIHQPSGRIYNTTFNPPKVEGRDDHTGEILVQREDDKPATVAARLDGYKDWETKVAHFFKQQNSKMLTTFEGSHTNEIWPSVFDWLSSRIEPQRKTDYGMKP